MAKKRKRIRYGQDRCTTVRQVLENGDWRQLTFAQKVFTALTWCGFTNSEAWGVICPNSEASSNSKAVMAGRYACDVNIKAYVEILNTHLMEAKLRFKGQTFKIGERQVYDFEQSMLE